MIIASFLNVTGSSLFTKPRITKPAKLRGKIVGSGRPGSITDVMLHYVLKKKLNLDPARDVKVVPLGDGPSILPALEKGVVDGTVLTTPTRLMAKTMGFREMLDFDELGIPYPYVGVSTLKANVKKNPEMTVLVEVEKALLSHSGIREAVVTTDRTQSDDARLIAYFTFAGESAPTASDLRMHLQEKLADYMIPSAFVKLDKIPLNANGKFDRGALPDPDDKRPPLSTLYALPRNEMEKSLVQIWEDVLGVRPIGIQDKFLDLGGHSLSATRVVSRVIKQFELDISLQSLFRIPTVADMAAEITVHQGKTLDESELATILDELESLSEAEAERLVSKNNSPITKK